MIDRSACELAPLTAPVLWQLEPDLQTTVVRAHIRALVVGRRGVLLEDGQLVLAALPTPPQPLPQWIIGSVGATPTLHRWSAALGAEGWQSVVFASDGACGLDRDGDVLCTAGHAEPARLRVVVRHAEALATGGARCAIGSGELSCWTSVTSEAPRAPAGIEVRGATAVAGSDEHACAIDGRGRLACWGHGNEGQLGDGVTHHRPPQPARIIEGLEDVRAVAASGATTCAIDVQGVACWGLSSWGQAGPGDLECAVGARSACQYVPARISLPGTATQLAVTSTTSCALLAGGDVWCWGVMHGPSYPTSLGRAAPPPCWLAPRLILRGVTSIAASNAGEICALGDDRVACFGWDGRHDVAAPTLVFGIAET